MLFVGLLAGACGDAGTSSNPTPTAAPGPTHNASVTIGRTTAGTFQVMASTIVEVTWEWWLFQRFPRAQTLLSDMAARHTLIVLDWNEWVPVIPQVDRDPTSPSAWSFTNLDAIVQPILGMGDHSPDFMISAAPPWMYDANHKLTDLAGFAEYAANLVRYYNGPGIRLRDGTTLRSASPYPIQYWSILNETNLSGTEYIRLYNVVVPAMRAVDPSLKFVAAEIAYANTQQMRDFMTAFAQGVTAQVDVVGIHFVPSGWQDSDLKVLSYALDSGPVVRLVYDLLSTNPRLANVPVWITSYNSPAWGLTDPRPTSPFYAAWAPYVFSQMGQAGAQSFHHWEFAANVQFGEIDQETGNTFLSYWVDYWLGRYFSTPPGQELLSLSNQSDPANVETLAVRRRDGTVVGMLVDHAVADPLDNNGKGVPYTITVDVSSLGVFSAAKELVVDVTTDVAHGPTERTIPYSTRIPVNLNGYGVAFISLMP